MGESNLMPISFGFFATIFVVETSPRLPHRESALAFVPTCSTSRDHPRAEGGQDYDAESALLMLLRMMMMLRFLSMLFIPNLQNEHLQTSKFCLKILFKGEKCYSRELQSTSNNIKWGMEATLKNKSDFVECWINIYCSIGERECEQSCFAAIGIQ